MDRPRAWRRRQSHRGLRSPVAALLVALVCLGAVTAGVWLGKSVYDALLVGRPRETGGGQAVETWSVLPPGAELWWVQVGAFLDLARARTVEASLEKLGYPVYVSSRGPSPVLHRVRAGVFATKGRATALERELKAAGFEDVYLSALPMNAYPVTIAAGDPAYLEELAGGLELLGGFLADQAGWWGTVGSWELDRAAAQAALASLAAPIRQFQSLLAAGPAPAAGAEIHQQATVLAGLAVGNLSELEAYAEKGERARMRGAMVEFMRLVDAYDSFWSSE